MFKNDDQMVTQSEKDRKGTLIKYKSHFIIKGFEQKNALTIWTLLYM
jgi:hypothetical protein